MEAERGKWNDPLHCQRFGHGLTAACTEGKHGLPGQGLLTFFLLNRVKDQRISGLRLLSGSVTSMAAPAPAGVMYAAWGMSVALDE